MHSSAAALVIFALGCGATTRAQVDSKQVDPAHRDAKHRDSGRGDGRRASTSDELAGLPATETGRATAASDTSGEKGKSGPSGPAGFVSWCSSGGAPIVGSPVLDAQERAYVATSDGYLHAFERDGRFRWSYTVKGTPLGSVSLRPSDGSILIGTTAKRIYAISQSGTLRWTFETLTPVWSGLFGLNDSTVVFLGHDSRLYALGNNGAARYRVRAPTDPMGGPVIAENDVVWLPLVDGVARFEAAFRLLRYSLPHPVEQVVVLGKGIVTRGGGKAAFVSDQGQVTPLGPARFVASDGKRAITADDEGNLTLYGEDLLETRLTSFDLGERKLSDAPALGRAGTREGEQVWIPTTDGTLLVFDMRTGDVKSVVVTSRALSTPVVGKSGRAALVPDSGGQFCAVELAGSPSL